MKNKKIKILGIETSCDDTAVALIEAGGGFDSLEFNILKNELSSQVKIHAEYGGIVPGLAKREHSRNLIPVLYKVLELDSGMPNSKTQTLNENQKPKNKDKKLEAIEKILEKNPELLKEFKGKVLPIENPNIDLIAVTQGPGLEPALWVGLNFARALSVLWDVPIIGVDHMEGHIAANLLQIESAIEFPALALAVSGGHTQLILVNKWLDYELIGETVDDAAGEAFDKVARLLGLPFPGGPHIEKAAQKGNIKAFDFPRPMLNSKNYNFSFSGLKTSVLYTLKKMSEEEIKNKQADIAASFQQAAIDTLVKKTVSAAKECGVKSILLGGGVVANKKLQEDMQKALEKEKPEANLYLPSIKLATDNAAMIAAAGYLRHIHSEKSDQESMRAESGKEIENDF